MADPSVGAPPCQILDDEELEKQGRYRSWREEPRSTMAATRIFGGSGAAAAAAAAPYMSGVRGFPSAFRTYRPNTGSSIPPRSAASDMRPFPFQVQKKKGAGPAQTPKREAVGGEPRSLVNQVMATFNAEAVVNDIVERGIHLLDIQTGEEKRCDPPYAACTPPQCHSPATPPIFDEPSK